MRLPARVSLFALALSAAVAVGAGVGVSRAADDAGAGTAATGTVSGRVVDADGKPVANARVGVISLEALKEARKERKEAGTSGEKGERPKAVAKGKTGEDGTFTLSGVPAGKYRLIAGLKGTGVGLAKEVVTVSADQTASVGDVQLHAPKAKAEKPATQPAQ